jgi:type I restriction enzyme, S subunit
MKNDRLSVSRYPAYKDSTVNWLGDVPKHWSIYQFKNIAFYQEGPGLRNWQFRDDGVKVICVTNITPPSINFEKLKKYISLDEYETMYKHFTVRKGDLLLASSGASWGKLSTYDLDENVILNTSTIRIHTSREAIVSTHFIKWILQSGYIYDSLIVLLTGSCQPNFGSTHLSRLYVSLPPLCEQKEVAHYLDTKTAQIDHKIDLLTQKAEQYGNLKQSLINETVTRGFDRSVPMKDSEGEWCDCVPSDWNEKRVKDLFRLITDVAPDNNDYELLSVYASIGVRPRKDLEQRGNKASTTDGYWIVKKGDIVVNKLLAWMGSIGLSNYEGVTSPAYDVLRKLNNDIEERFYGYLFRTGKAQEIFKKSSRGIMDMRLRLYFDKLGAITVPVPPIAEQKSIADYLDTKTAQIERVIQTINTQIGKLKEFRKTLINDVVTGKIKVV